MNDKIIPCLWFEKDLAQVIEYYTSIFQKELQVSYLGEREYGPGGEYQYGTIEIFGKSYQMLAAGPMFRFTEAISLTIMCEDQAEVDYYWKSLTKNGGSESMCGWCKDRYGLSWQIIPKKLLEIQMSTDKQKRDYGISQMLQMKKIIIQDLEL